MRYENVVKGKFISRPNRFIAYVDINGKTERAHVKNTGRCRELLLEGAEVYLQHHENTVRSTEWSLIGVRKGDRLINIDSQAPNKVVYEWLQEMKAADKNDQSNFKRENCTRFWHFPRNIIKIRPEYTYGDSRIDFFVETELEKILIEVKGVTLEENNVAMFPDAPTERGIKHVQELIGSLKEGYNAYIVFIIQMEGVRRFTPNAFTHKAFADILKLADKKGVRVIALDCIVGEDLLSVNKRIEVIL
jgi:sugar fermentation stimulation protein A